MERIKGMIDNGVTVLLVSHNIDTIRSMCSRALLLEKGRVRGVGDVDEVCRLYER